MKGSTLGGPYDWNFTTVPQTSAKNRIFPAPRGKLLGGTAAHNLMSWDRASSAEYDWEMLGNPGWTWDRMIAAMMKAETFEPSPLYGSTGVGTSGPIKSVINRIVPEHQLPWIPTLNSMGVPSNLESLGGDPLGVMYQPGNIDPAPWNRSYAATGYLPLAGSNMEVMTNTRVAKVNLQAFGNGLQKATGVTLQDGTVISAREEVIISAGSFQSPGLLELSGIGSASVLSAAGIPQIVDLPTVGENLQDHIRIQTSFQVKDNYTSFNELTHNATFRDEQMALRLAGEHSWYDYTASGYAFLNWQHISSAAASTMSNLATSIFGASTSAVIRKKLAWLANPAVPQVELIFSDGYTGVKGYPAVGSPLYGKNLVTLIAVIMHPFSRGNVHVTSSNIEDTPAINPNYLSNEYDVQAAMTAIKHARKVANTEPLRGIWDAEYDPGLELVPEQDNEAQYREFALNTTLTIYHPVGTCAMLPREDGGVVDPRLVVYGTSNLRVVDASIMPVLISAHIQTAVYGIAEVAADLIIEDHNERN